MPTRFPIIKFKNGLLHCANGPARIWNDDDDGWGWYLYGKFHRYYGPRSSAGNWWIHYRKIK